MQVAESVEGRRRIVAHVGSAHTEAELGLLLARAEEMLADARQDELDLGLEPTPRKTELVGPPSDQDAGEGLFDLTVSGPVSGSVSGPIAAGDERPRVAAPRVVGTCSRLLYDALAGVFDDLGFDAVADATFRDLVIARVVEPTSILDTGRVLTDLGREPASEKTMRRTLARAQERGYRDKVTTACFNHVLTSGDVSLCLYDVTTLYFEAEHEDTLRKVGYSKERRVDPQVVVGLLVDREGFPLEIGCYEGNKAEKLTILPIVKQFAKRHDLTDFVVVADAGMLSAGNLAELDEAEFRFIVGSRATKAPVDLASHFRWHGEVFTNGQVIDTITPKTQRGGTGSASNPQVKAEPVWNPEQHPSSWRAVWAYSAKRWARDNKTLTLQENRAREVVAGQKSARTPRFVKTTNGSASLDEASLARARRLAGLKGYVTNIDASMMSAAEVIASYHDLWHVEQSFRMSKTDLRARPMFHHKRDSIEAHLTIVFTALALSREAQNRTGLAIRNLTRQLRPLRSATLAINGTELTIPPAIPDDKQDILDALRTPRLRH